MSVFSFCFVFVFWFLMKIEFLFFIISFYFDLVRSYGGGRTHCVSLQRSKSLSFFSMAVVCVFCYFFLILENWILINLTT